MNIFCTYVNLVFCTYMSWSYRLFFKINSQIGKRLWFDRLMYFCAHWLVYIMGFIMLSWGAFFLENSDFRMVVKLILTALFFATVFSYLLGYLWRHPRPIVEFPNIKTLLNTIETWKSFPSDHTLVSFSFAFSTILIDVTPWLTVILIIIASFIAFGRVWVGVHYPRDIIGGIIVAVLFVWISPWLLQNVTQPLYNAVRLFLN